MSACLSFRAKHEPPNDSYFDLLLIRYAIYILKSQKRLVEGYRLVKGELIRQRGLLRSTGFCKRSGGYLFYGL